MEAAAGRRVGRSIQGSINRIHALGALRIEEVRSLKNLWLFLRKLHGVRQDRICCFLANHVNRADDEKTGNARENRSVDDPQTFGPMDRKSLLNTPPVSLGPMGQVHEA